MDEVNNDYIDKALRELIPTLGAKEFIDYTILYNLFQAKKYKECIKEMALYLGLPIEVNLSYVPNDYRQYSNDGFQSTQLVKTDGEGRAGITAQITIPSYLPLYGSPSMVNFPINVLISEKCINIAATFIVVMAHELSHIVLHSLRHREKENEFYTDLTAMLLGFADIIQIGRKHIYTISSTKYEDVSSVTTTTEHTDSYGYLSDNNFYFAFFKIQDVLRKHNSAKDKFSKKLKQFKKQLDKTNKLYLYFTKYLEYLSININKNISREEGHKIGAFCESGYTDNFQSIVKKSEESLDAILKFVENFKHYTEHNLGIMKQYEGQLKSASEELRKQRSLLQKDVKVLEKYVSFFYKLELWVTSILFRNPPKSEIKYIFECEKCSQKLRIPHKKETIIVSCIKCKNSFKVKNGKRI